MKIKELDSMSVENLQKKVAELRKELVKLNAQVATGTAPKNVMQIKQTKKTISRIFTMLNQKKVKKQELGGE